MPGDRNITIDPLAAATPVDDPEIKEVLDLVSGTFQDVNTYIRSHRYGDFVNERVRVREALAENPLFACSLCATSVYVVASPEKKFFFRHRVEDGSCPAQTRGTLNQAEILARKYHALRESQAHKRIKHLIERSIAADSSFAAETILQEKRWRSSKDPNVWRQPDVQAKRGDQRFAFEVQLSTTFLNVVVERRKFYREEGANLVWVFGHFSPGYRRMTTDDLLFPNNANVFVVDEETTRLSEETRSFHLRCYYLCPLCEGDAIKEVWCEKLVRFCDLTSDVQNQQTYFFDHAGEKGRLQKGLDDDLRGAMFEFWPSVAPHFDRSAQSWERWNTLKSKFAIRGIALPEHPSADSNFRAVMHAMLSAVNGKPIGWQFHRLIEVAHHLAQGHPQLLLWFGFALDHAGHRDLLAAQDVSGRWMNKRTLLRDHIKAADTTYYPDMQWLKVLEYLFPEVAKRVEEFLDRHWPKSNAAE
jgi:Family of unknown function (DUF6035)